MSSEERLRSAAHIAGDAIMKSYAADAEPDHQFSPEFERKMELLIQQIRNKAHYSLLQKVAGIILAIAIGSSIWLSVDTDARAAVFGWIRQQYENIFHYHFDGDADVTSETSYELGWLPEGYRLIRHGDTEGSRRQIYADESGKIITFIYKTSVENGSSDFFILDDFSERESVKIGYSTADLYIDSTPDGLNAIVWEDVNTNCLLAISAAEDSDTLVKLAENVLKKNFFP